MLPQANPKAQPTWTRSLGLQCFAFLLGPSGSTPFPSEMPPYRWTWLWALEAAFLVSLLFSASASAGPTNRTIDDTNGDSATGLIPAYSGSWNVGQNCPGCRVQPSKSDVFDGTWHDTTSDSGATTPHTVTLSFQGASADMSSKYQAGPWNTPLVSSRDCNMGVLRPRQLGPTVCNHKQQH